MKNYFAQFLTPIILSGIMGGCGTDLKELDSEYEVNQKVESLISEMTVEEKVGQLNFYVGDVFITGPQGDKVIDTRFDDLIREGKITGLFNTHGAEYIGRLQKIATEESRLGIPLIIGADIIHGFKTIFPIPLAEAASWDMEAIELSSRVAARESTSAGINLNFAPMVDISRDARWGRSAEGSGEDPFLGSKIAAARVIGFQGNDLSDSSTFAACVKHFAAYGAPFGGRDYNTVDMSERMLREIYLPPYKAAIDAGSATIMTAFNELNGIPATGNKFLLDEILRKEWGFEGVVISDWQSIGEMLFHGNVADSLEAARLSLEAGTDMDMMADIYLKKIPLLIESGELEMAYLDNAVRRILKLKFDLGLFENPNIYSDSLREEKELRSEENLQAALEVARKSIVLLKNEDEILPLKTDLSTIAIIGPYAEEKAEHNGTWSFFAEHDHPVSILEGIQNIVGSNTQLLTANGVDFYSDKLDGISDAVSKAKEADVVLLAVGESAVMNGEGASRSIIGMPGKQMELIKAIKQTGKPIVALVHSGRPLDLSWLDKNVDAILQVWSLGSQAGNAIADVVFGEYNPSGRLPVSFPRNVGQVPIFYNSKNTGRPYEGNYDEPKSERVYRSKYRDVETTPLYPFGYGLSYTKFSYTNLVVDPLMSGTEDPVNISVTVTNTGQATGEETVQLYIRDLVASATRPVKELKGFKKITLAPGESETVDFTLGSNDLAFYRADMSFGVEPGEFKVFVGPNSRDCLEARFTLSSELQNMKAGSQNTATTFTTIIIILVVLGIINYLIIKFESGEHP